MQEDSGPGKEHVALAGPNPEHMDEDFYATAYPKVHENLKLRTDEHVILENPESSSATLSSMKNLDETDNFGDQFLNDKPTEDDQEKTNVVDETDSIIPDLSHQTNTSAPSVTTLVINILSPKPSSQLRVVKLEQDMSEVKKTDHSADVLASIQSQVPTVVDKYLGTKVDDALLKALEKHTTDLIQKYFGLPAPESSKKQESEKSPKEILGIKREQEEHKHVKDHNETHNSDEDESDDDGRPFFSAGSNQGKSTKRRRHDSGASGSAQPSSKDSDQSTKNKLDSDASAAQQPPAHMSFC
ncbi:hypothetical protein Tco_1327871 [Tanacetum coccineum]